MATGIELWLGYTYPEYHKKAPPDAPRVPWPLPTDGSEDGPRETWPDEFYAYSRRKDVREPLVQAWLGAVKEMGWGIATPAKGKARTYFNVNTVAGKDEFSPFSLDKQFGGEMEFDFPHVPIGVPLSGRYFPVFLDHKSSGCLSNPLNLEDPELLRMITIARQHITNAVLWLAAAKLMVVLIHY